MENDDVAGNEVTVTVEITVRGDDLAVAVRSPLALPTYRNSYAGLTRGAVYFGILTALPPGLPIDGGVYRAIAVDVGPKGTMLNAELPTACAMSTSDVWGTVFDAVCGATSQIVPERACAGWTRPSMLQMSGRDPETGAPYSSFLSIAFIGGAGASHAVDGGGLWGMVSTAGAATTGDIELLEFRLPLHFHRHELATDSACPGRWRGAAGAVLEFEPVDHDGVASHDGDGVRLPSVSRLGGGSPRDAEKRTHVKRVERLDGSQDPIEPRSRKPVRVGERVYCRVTGGGAIGPAVERPIEAVVADVEAGIVSVESAAEEYGVVIEDGLGVNVEATEERRREIAARSVSAER
jgi:N-methylhydantoinase B